MSDISSNLRSFFTDKVRTYNSIYIVNGFLEKLFSLKAISPQPRTPWNGGFRPHPRPTPTAQPMERRLPASAPRPTPTA